VPNFEFLGQKPIGTACLDALLNEFDSSTIKLERIENEKLSNDLKDRALGFRIGGI
jgi:hypothetical protein